MPIPLTAKEEEILALVCDGMGGVDISKQLHIKHDTVRKHMSNIYNKTGYSTALELAVRTLQKQYGYYGS